MGVTTRRGRSTYNFNTPQPIPAAAAVRRTARRRRPPSPSSSRSPSRSPSPSTSPSPSPSPSYSRSRSRSRSHPPSPPPRSPPSRGTSRSPPPPPISLNRPRGRRTNRRAPSPSPSPTPWQSRSQSPTWWGGKNRGPTSPVAAKIAMAANTGVVPGPGASTPYPLDSPFVEEVQTPFSFLYRPHTMTALAVSFIVILYNAFAPDTEPVTPSSGLKRGLSSVSVAFLSYCVVQLRDTVMVRPHPAIWRLVHGIAILYLMFLVYLLAQAEPNARRFLAQFYPELGQQNPDNNRVYAQDCRVFTPENPHSNFANVRDSVFDIFVAAHFLGALGKTIIFRDWKLTWTLLVLWEIVEYSTQHILPNFMECWFDHWFVDVFGFNLLGMLCGLGICRMFSMMRYDWTGYDVSTWSWGRVLRQFSPYEWTTYDWRVFSDYRRFLSVVMAIVLFEVAELNAFFLKYVLYIPPSNFLNMYRLTLWGALGLPAFREYHIYATDKTCKRLGPNVWLSLAILLVEVAVIFKFGRHLPNFQNPTPPEVFYGWLAVLLCLTCWTILRFAQLPELFTGFSTVRRLLLKSLILMGVAALAVIAITQDVGYGKNPPGLHPTTP